MIKPVTYQGVFNFKSNLYALEVKSRFIDQSKANGYYTGYGNELAATIVNNQIQIGTGAFVIQGRMNEVDSAETLSVTIENGKVGYVVARIETYHPSDEENCKFVIKTATSFDAIELTQEDTYAKGAETSNKVFELPIYSFVMANGNITQLTKVIEKCGDYEKLKKVADDAMTAANNAVASANNAVTTANTAKQTAEKATETAEKATITANKATETASTATTNVTRLESEVEEFKNRVITGQGTAITKGGEQLNDFEVSETPTANVGAVYDSNGNIKTNAPFNDSDCVRLVDLFNIVNGGGINTPLYDSDNSNIIDSDNNVIESFITLK